MHDPLNESDRRVERLVAHVVEPAAPANASPEPKATPATSEPTVYKGTLTVNADRPGATVFVNRKSVGTAPVRVRNLRPARTSSGSSETATAAGRGSSPSPPSV